MKKISIIFMWILLGSLLTGCAVSRGAQAREAKNKLIGRSQSSILRCMGAPDQKYNEDNVSVWKYHSGGDTERFFSQSERGQSSAFFLPNNGYGRSQRFNFGAGGEKRFYCVINIVFENKRVSAVNYSGRTGELFTQGAQCYYAIKNCL